LTFLTVSGPAVRFLAAAIMLAAAPSADALEGAPRSSDIAIPMDERGVRTAGISTVAVEPDHGGTDVHLPGTVAIPQQQIRVVAAPAGGLVEAMLIAADESVEAGQQIARLRSPDIVESQRQFLAALADDALAADRLRRAQMLFDGRAIPERDLRTAQTEATVAKSRLDERTQILSLMGMSDADVDTLRNARRIFSTVTVQSPITGTVVTRHTSVGERVDRAAPLFTIAQLDPLWINIQVPAARLANVAVGAVVVLPAQGAQGRIIRIGRTIDPATQSATVVAELAGVGDKVRPGLAVNATVRVQPDDGGRASAGRWTVPSAAVVRHRGRSWVFVRAPDGFSARPVEVIAEDARIVLVRGDLAAGEQVAARGLLALLAALAEADQD
jgi:RND family efflux transporter MFP subunit